MTTNEIKKELYKSKADAFMVYAKKGLLRYICDLPSGTRVRFEIPFEDMGDGVFEPKMPGRLLNRWIVN